MEKIKISVPEKIYRLLQSDAKDFRILKPSGEVNLNAFINLLVVNFHEEFAADDEMLRESILGALSTLPEKYAKEAFSRVMSALAKREKADEAEGKSIALSFKPTKASEGVTVYIENVLLKNESLSSFYRRMFLSYSQKLKNEREKIIHKQNYQLLSTAAKKGIKVCLSLEQDTVMNDASVYAIAASKDELFNYALFVCNKKNRTVRLAKIKTVSLLTQNADISEEAEERFARQIVAGAQYPIYSTDNQPIKVRLSAKGKGLFERIYLYRPTPVSVEGDVYTFDCSASQALFYFQRFGDEALILSPKRLGISMLNFHHFALKKYRSFYGKHYKLDES